MAEYTFPEGWQPYAASLGVQGLLLGLNFALPSFLRKSRGILQKGMLLFLTAVVLFCSSWFSYLFIAGQAYGDSWKTERQLLAQAVYREELFAADTYTEKYGEQTELALQDQLMDLYNRAAEMDKNRVDVCANLEWDVERISYAAEGNYARDVMLTTIEAMEAATQEGADPELRERARETLSGMHASLEGNIDRFNGPISSVDARVQAADAAVTAAANRLSRVPAGVDPAPYVSAHGQASENYQEQLSRRHVLEKENSDYQNALRRMDFYLTVLGVEQEGVSSYFIGENLRQIQTELFGDLPDAGKMLQLAVHCG